MALASLAALGLAIFLGFVKKMNTGLLCTALALLVGRLAGISDDEIIRGFNYSLFLMLLGVTYLFGLAEMNGTLALLSKKIVALSGRRTYLVPIVMYLFATILSALGPGTIPTAAIMMVFGMTLAKEMNINPAMLGAIIFLGAAGGGMSPLAATGIIGLNLCGEFGLTGIEEPLLVNGVLSSTVYAALVYFAFGGYRLRSDIVLHLADTPSFARQQIITLIGIAGMVVLVLFFHINVGLASFGVAAILSFLNVSDETAALRRIPWGDASSDLRCRRADECHHFDWWDRSSLRCACFHHERLDRSQHSGDHGRRPFVVLLDLRCRHAHAHSDRAAYPVTDGKQC